MEKSKEPVSQKLSTPDWIALAILPAYAFLFVSFVSNSAVSDGLNLMLEVIMGN